MKRPPLHGILFDLDGTLVDSALDFEQIRREMGLAPGTPILEALASLPPADRARCCEILEQHEQAGALRATLMPGALEFLAAVEQRRLRRAIITRNARKLVLALLERLQLEFDPVVAREDGPAKPDPEAVWQVCRAWNVEPAEVLVIGDFHYDIEAGRRAGARTALFAAQRNVALLPWAADADEVVNSFTEAYRLLE